MEMIEIVKEMRKNLEDMASEMKTLEQKIENKNKEIEKLQNEKNEMEYKFADLKNRSVSLEMSLDILKEGGFELKDYKDCIVSKPEEQIADEKKEKKESKKAYSNKANHKNAFVLIFNEYDNVIDRYRTQGLAAKKLNLAQTTVSYWMRRTKEQQLKKLGYYMAWEY